MIDHRVEIDEGEFDGIVRISALHGEGIGDLGWLIDICKFDLRSLFVVVSYIVKMDEILNKKKKNEHNKEDQRKRREDEMMTKLKNNKKMLDMKRSKREGEEEGNIKLCLVGETNVGE